ncbi:alanyl-tRNA synthetase [mine drainage metagenome]|uniref:Alanine--tRNA ligase n=3 Tax=mine drainage metagenome TaxID=410659 RepID=T1C2C6_9ZZZZ
MDLKIIRDSFTSYFEGCGHVVVPSSSLVPTQDPTLLFTNSGMVQFKDLFLGLETRPYRRAVSVQRCLRAGGKHNDLENVGYTARHHTFFEMLGNFSFGDYFKEEAITLAWRYLTNTLALDPERLWVTIHPDDEAAYAIWTRVIGLPKSRLRRIPGDDNFWSMGETGPCGPSSEIFFDHGPRAAGGPPGSDTASGDRYVEIWNLVFMQFNRNESGALTPLPNPCVDTGMGLERIAAVLEGVPSNYDIEHFRTLVAAAADSIACSSRESNSLRVIADHARAATFLISDGIRPGNEGRAYVLRRIIRRAVRHGVKEGAEGPFLHRLVPVVGALMAPSYPELSEAVLAEAALEIRREEERFERTLRQGLQVLEEGLATLSGEVIPGALAFRLSDTYGFPIDLLIDTARERGFGVDLAGYEALMTIQRERARRESEFGAHHRIPLDAEATEFLGYGCLETESRIATIFSGTQPVERLEEGARGALVLDRTPFYPESGGQVGDTGLIETPDARFRVEDTERAGQFVIHRGTLEVGVLACGARVQARVDAARRLETMRNHSATHLLHASLRTVLGTHVAQKGSLVAPDRLRFDFSHPAPLTADERDAVETLVFREIIANRPVVTRVMAFDDARRLGAMALFGEKYGERVRVLTMGEFSIELCGGTHVQMTGEIGGFKIVNENGLASGIRRIEAVTGEGLLRWMQEAGRVRSELQTLLGVGPEDWGARIRQLQERERALGESLKEAKRRLVGATESDPSAAPVEIEGIRVVARRIDGADVPSLRAGVDRIRNECKKAIVVLASVEDGRVRIVSGVTAAESKRAPARELVAHIASRIGGRGGGRADLAEGGGGDPQALDQVLAEIPDWVRNRLKRSA